MANLLDVLSSLNPITSVIKEVIDRVVPDKAAAEAAKQEVDKADQSGELQLLLGQISVNIEEAKSGNLFVSGWRPAAGWICVAGLGYSSILEPVARFIATVVYKYAGAFPAIDTSITLQILLGMLGIAGMRSFEKYKSIAAK